MGNFSFYKVDTTPQEDENVNLARRDDVVKSTRGTYIGGLVAWVVIWLVLMYMNSVDRLPVSLGFLVAAAFMAANIFQADTETIGTYQAEKAEAMNLDRNSFSLVVALFEIGRAHV